MEKNRRKDERKLFKTVMFVDEFYNQSENIKFRNNVDITIVNISKGGIGFISEEDLPLEFYFNAKIDLGESKMFFSVLHITRKEYIEDEKIEYGCKFIGLADVLSDYIDEY